PSAGWTRQNRAGHPPDAAYFVISRWIVFGRSSTHVVPGARSIGSPFASRYSVRSCRVGRLHVPLMTFPFRNTKQAPFPVVTTSGEGLPAASLIPVVRIFETWTTTFVALMEEPPSRVAGPVS